MKTFEIEVDETVRYTYTVKAVDRTQARRIVSLMHDDDGADKAGAATETISQCIVHTREVRDE